MKIFITGGTGFIGKFLVRKLQEREHRLLLLVPASEIISPDNLAGNSECLRGDFSDMNRWENALKKFQPEAAIHLAWEGIPDYGYKTSVKNLRYGLELITLLAELRCQRVISTGSCWEYGPIQGKLSEDLIQKPTNAFTAAKISLQQMGAEIAKEKNMYFIWLRLFYVYGPGQREESLIPYIVNCLLEGRHPDIKTISAKNDFIYVEDVAEAISMVLEKCNNTALYNIGAGYSTQVAEVIKTVSNDLGVPYAPESKQDGKEPSVDFWADISRIREDIGWGPKVNIREGIHRTAAYFKALRM